MAWWSLWCGKWRIMVISLCFSKEYGMTVIDIVSLSTRKYNLCIYKHTTPQKCCFITRTSASYGHLNYVYGMCNISVIEFVKWFERVHAVAIWTATLTDTGILKTLMCIHDRFVCYIDACGHANTMCQGVICRIPVSVAMKPEEGSRLLLNSSVLCWECLW